MKLFAKSAAVLHFPKCKILTASMKLVFAVVLLAAFFHSVSAQQQPVTKIDHLTTTEDDLIHETQELDKRVEIFVKAIERRLMVLNPATETKTAVKASKETKKKDVDKLGQLPTGTHAEMLGDIKSILDEAVRNIDNAAEHDAKNVILPKALKKLADGCSRFTSQLKPFYDSAQSERERADVYDALENCREIIEANTKQNTATAN
jgi:C4-dicarboxylate-specific signal transduction histidine kinase